jgi:branched-chain amino acid transport system substrate-binding protein
MTEPNVNLPLRIGLLSPPSRLHPLLGRNLADGLRLGLRHANATGVTIVEADAGSSVHSAVDAIRTLLADGQADLLVGAVLPSVGAEIGPLLERSGALFIGTDGGANLVRPEEQTARAFYNSLGYWQANWAMGAWAARHMGRTAFVAASLYESGYDAISAFRLGFEAAGGRVVETAVTHRPPEPTDWPAFAAAVRQARPDFVYGLYSGAEAISFVRAYDRLGLARQFPLAAAPFTVDETLLPELGQAAVGIRSCHIWSAALQTPENQAFKAAFAAAAGRSPDSFALVGYDTAFLIAGALRSAGSLSGLPDALASSQWSSPRGRLKMTPSTHSSAAPLYVREVTRVGGQVENTVIATVTGPAESDASLASLRTGLRTGWVHAYLGV